MADIKAYKPQSNSLGSRQVLQQPYTFDNALIVITEMADSLALDLVAKGLVTNQIVITVGYDIDNEGYTGEYSTDSYGRRIPVHAHGTYNLKNYTSSGRAIRYAATELFSKITDKNLNIRRLNITAARVIKEGELPADQPKQISIFLEAEEERAREELTNTEESKERKRQQAVIEMRKKYGKNAVLKGVSLEEGATAKSRNEQIGGHKA